MIKHLTWPINMAFAALEAYVKTYNYQIDSFFIYTLVKPANPHFSMQTSIYMALGYQNVFCPSKVSTTDFLVLNYLWNIFRLHD